MPTKAKTFRPRPKAPRARDDQFYRRARWLRLAELVRRKQPTCRDPDKRHEGEVRITACVDHIKSRANYPELEYDYDNLQGLCWSCHSAKTIREMAE